MDKSKNMEDSISIDNNLNKSTTGSLVNKYKDISGLYRYTAQMLLIYCVFAASVWGLTYGDTNNKDVWLVLLSTITGIGLPSPKISKRR